MDATKPAVGPRGLRWGWAISVALSIAVGTAVILVWYLRLGPMWSAFGAIDYDTYIAFVQRWLDTGSMYLPAQLLGQFDPRPLPHVPAVMPSLYPPHAVYLFAPFQVLPAAVWWIVPLGVLAYVLWAWRPSTWAWPVMLALLLPQESTAIPVAGNTTMWMVAALAAGIRWGWPVLLLTTKPSLLPFAIAGIRHANARVGAVVVIALMLPFGGLWLDYVTVLWNARTDLLYSLWSLPLMALPLVAYLGRTALRER